MSQNPASDGDFCSSQSEIPAGRSRGGWLVLPGFPSLPARKETCWHGSAGTGAAAPSVPARRGWRRQLPLEGLHPSPFSITQAPSPPSLPLLQGGSAGWKRRGCCNDGGLRLGLYLDTSVPWKGLFLCTVAQVWWGCAPSLPAQQLGRRSRSSGRWWRGVRALGTARPPKPPCQPGRRQTEGFG